MWWFYEDRNSCQAGVWGEKWSSFSIFIHLSLPFGPSSPITQNLASEYDLLEWSFVVGCIMWNVLEERGHLGFTLNREPSERQYLTRNALRDTYYMQPMYAPFQTASLISRSSSLRWRMLHRTMHYISIPRKRRSYIIQHNSVHMQTNDFNYLRSRTSPAEELHIRTGKAWTADLRLNKRCK